jgi:hypothetical protein
VANQETRRRFSPTQVGSMIRIEDGATSSYNALAVTLRKRFAKHYLLDVDYTFARSLDLQSNYNTGTFQNPNDLRADWALSDFYRKHVFTTSWVWELPGLSRAGFFGKHIIGGWQLSGILTLGSGQPINVVSGRDNSLTAVENDRPNVIGNPVLSTSRPKNEVVARYFNTSMFVANLPGQYGDSGRNPLIGPGLFNVDAGLFKNISLWEKAHLEFRSEFFNLFNHANFSNPNGSLISPAFGQITTAGTARQIQLALKLLF